MYKYLNDKRLWSIPKERSKPIYKLIEDLVVCRIREGTVKAGQPLPSYPWLAKTLGVADKTVRQAYASLQHAGILVIVSGKGTFAAPQGLGDAGSGPVNKGTVGVVLPAHGGLSSGAYATRFLWGVSEAAAGVGWTVLSGDTGQAERIAERQPDAGLVLLAKPEASAGRKLSVIPRPVIWAGVDEVEENWARATLDHEGAGRECAYKLVGAGHRRVGVLRLDRDLASRAFEQGVRHALGSAGVAIDPSAVQVVDRDAGETGLTAADALLGGDLTGVIVTGAPLLAVFSEAAWRRGRTIPGSVSVVALLTEPGPAWAGGVPVEAAVLDPAESGRCAIRLLREWAPESPGRVERIALQWQRGQSLAPPSGSPV